MMDKTYGIFLLNTNNELLIGHPTGFKYSKWSIPKGHSETEDIDNFSSAKRELLEESNVDLNDLKFTTYYLGHQKYINKDKILIAFLCILHEPCNVELKCNSFFDREDEQVPELDLLKWISFDKYNFYLQGEQQLIINKNLDLFKSILNE